MDFLRLLASVRNPVLDAVMSGVTYFGVGDRVYGGGAAAVLVHR